MDILKKIELYRKEEEMLKWEGTFREYLEIIKEKPWVAQSAHSRVYNMIKDSGVEEEKGVKKYEFFSNQLFGLEESLERLSRGIFASIGKKARCPKKDSAINGSGQWW